MNPMNRIMAAGQANGALNAAMAPTLPNPSEKEIARQHMLIVELFKRIDALANAMERLGATPPPQVFNQLPEMNVTVEASKVEMPAPVVNVEQPDINVAAPNVTVAAPNVNVEAPNVTVNPPQVHVSAPNVNVAAPAVNVEQAAVTFNPSISVAQHTEWEFKHYYDDFSGRPTRTVARVIDQSPLDS